MKDVIKKWWFWLLVVSIFILYVMMFISNIKPKFEVTDFKINSEMTDYTYATNTITYVGNGILTTSDKKGIYIVALKQTLISGGTEDSKKEDIITIIVNKGKGEFLTYDYGEEGKIEKPNYEFKVIGSQKIN